MKEGIPKRKDLTGEFMQKKLEFFSTEAVIPGRYYERNSSDPSRKHQNFSYIVEDEDTSENSMVIIDPSWDLIDM